MNMITASFKITIPSEYKYRSNYHSLKLSFSISLFIFAV